MAIRHKRLSTGLVLNLDGRTQPFDEGDRALLREASIVRIDPSNACNAECVFCESSFNSEAKRLPLELFDEALGELERSPNLNTLQFGCTYEPTIRREFSDFGRLLERRRFVSQPETLSIVSNCWILDRYDLGPFVRGGLNKLHVSVHAHEPETYRQVMGRDHLERVARTLRAVKAEHPQVVVSAVCVVNSLNVRDPLGFARWAFQEVGVDYLRFTRAQIFGDRADSPALAALADKPQGFTYEVSDAQWAEFARELEDVGALGLELQVSQQRLKNGDFSVDALRIRRAGAPSEINALRASRRAFLETAGRVAA
jgi:sulfatase maturation enzyme AslB (radical SAM superfamily)